MKVLIQMHKSVKTPVALACLGLLFSPWIYAENMQARTVIKSSQRSVLSSQLAGQVVTLPLHAGQKFSKNDILIGLDCRLYQAQMDKVEAQMSSAKSKLDNAYELEKLHSIGQLDIALAKSEFQQAKAELKMAKLNVSRCDIRAPWSGQVVGVNTRQYEYVPAQQPVIEILGDHSLYAEAIIQVSWLKRIKEGMQIHLYSSDLELTEPATIESVNPVIDPVSQTILVRIKLLKNTQMKVGISAEADFSQSVVDVQQ